MDCLAVWLLPLGAEVGGAQDFGGVFFFIWGCGGLDPEQPGAPSLPQGGAQQKRQSPLTTNYKALI